MCSKFGVMTFVIKLLFIVVYASLYDVIALDTVQPVAPLADDLRSSTISQSSVSRPSIIDDNERSVISGAAFLLTQPALPSNEHAVSKVQVWGCSNFGSVKDVATRSRGPSST